MSKYSIGLDIGTTSVSAAVVNNATGKTVYTNSRNHGAFIPSDESFFREQDPEKLYEIAVALLEDALGRFFPIGTIGLTGQMHGILYVDGSGKALSTPGRTTASFPLLQAARHMRKRSERRQVIPSVRDTVWEPTMHFSVKIRCLKMR